MIILITIKNDYCVIVPVLAGHNINEKEDFVSFDICAKELEEYYITKYGNKVFAIYGMSNGWNFSKLYLEE